MEHEAIAVLTFECINDLLVAGSAQSSNHQSLGLTAGKQGRAVSTWQYAIANFNRTHCACIATINPWLTIQNLATHNLRFDIKQNIANRYFINCAIGSHFCHDIFRDGF